jgi:pimeloyl-ACP methyl ester carboxylesterase
LALSAAFVIPGGGCGLPGRYGTRDRYAHGVVYILPGIEGRSVWNSALARGLDRGGVRSAIEIFDWTTGVPGGFIFNLANLERNRREAARLAGKIVAQRRRYPGSAVHLIGHSGGGGVAALVLEALPAGRQIDMAVLLAPALSPDYDLMTALRRTRFGVCNFYSEHDATFLKVGTAVFGAIDRDHGSSAGAVGFRPPAGLDADGRALYRDRLRQVRWTERLAKYGASGTHLGWASEEFAREYLAPIVIRNENARKTSAGVE